MKNALELIPGELQEVSLPEADIARAVSIAQAMNRTVREAADRRLKFEDEPGNYLGFIRAAAEGAE